MKSSILKSSKGNKPTEYRKEKYQVHYFVTGRYTANVESDSLEEAQQKAKDEFYNADFGELHDIGKDSNVKQMYATDENGKRYDLEFSTPIF